MMISFCTNSVENWNKVKKNHIDGKNNHSLVFNTKEHQELGYTLFSVDQKTLSPMAETFLLCGNVYLSFGQNQGSALSR